MPRRKAGGAGPPKENPGRRARGGNSRKCSDFAAQNSFRSDKVKRTRVAALRDVQNGSAAGMLPTTGIRTRGKWFGP